MLRNMPQFFASENLSSDELKILAQRNNIKNYGSLSRLNLIENLNRITDIHDQLPVQINKSVDEMSQIEKRILAQRIGITNIRKIPKAELKTILEKREINIPEIKPKAVRSRFSIRKPLLEQAKELGYRNYHNLNIEKLKELLQSPPVKRILKSDLIKQAKDIGIEIKNTMSKNFISDLIEKHTEFKKLKKINSAFIGYVNHFQLEGLPKIGVNAYLEKIKPILNGKINEENKFGLKIAIIIHVLIIIIIIIMSVFYIAHFLIRDQLNAL